MATCPKCDAKISDSATYCEYCGEKVIAGDTLMKVPQKITTWQKVIIGLSILVLIAIGLTYRGAEDRENRAAQQTFANPVESIVQAAARDSGLRAAYGEPVVSMNAETKKALVFIDFPSGPMSPVQASDFALNVCAKLARIYVQKGYMPRALAVGISSGGKQGVQIHYGTAVYNGNVDILGWEPAAIAK